MKRKIDTTIEAVKDEVTNKPVVKSKELIYFIDFYKDFNMDGVKFNESLQKFSCSLKLSKTRDVKVYEVCNLIYPSKYYKDKLTGKVKYEVVYLVKGRYEKILIEGDLKMSQLLNHLSSKGFTLKNNNNEIQTLFIKFFFDMLHFLYENKNPSELVSHFGLQENGGFAIGNIFINEDGTQDECDITDELIYLREEFRPKGSFEVYQDILNKIFALEGFSKHKFYILTMISSPVLGIVDRNGSLINFQSGGSNDKMGGSGLGKTVSQQISQLFYRRKSDIEMNFSVLSMMKEAGLVKNFPIFIDEISNAIKKTPEEIVNFIHYITNGSDKKRLDKNAQQKKTNTFKLNLGTSSNPTGYSIVAPDSIAELVRFCEISLNKDDKLEIANNEDELMKFALLMDKMKNNCGFGYVYVRKLLEQKATTISVFNGEYEYILKELFQQSNFRYIATSLAGAMTFAKVLNKSGIKIDINEMNETLKIIVSETLSKFNSYKISIDKVINDLIGSLTINHYSQEPCQPMKAMKEYIFNSRYDAIMINGKELVIPKVYFDNKICMSSDRRSKSMFNKTSREMIEFLNEDGEIVLVQQKNIEKERIQCVVIKLPTDYTVSMVDDEVEMPEDVFNEDKE